MQLRRFAWSCAVPALVLSAWMACAQSVPAVTGNERVDKLLSQMTLEEKLKLIHGTQEDPVLSLTKIPSGGKMDPGPEFIARFSDCFRLSRSCPVTAEHNENRTKHRTRWRSRLSRRFSSSLLNIGRHTGSPERRRCPPNPIHTMRLRRSGRSRCEGARMWRCSPRNVQDLWTRRVISISIMPSKKNVRTNWRRNMCKQL